jgi:hypothetical protein
MKDDVFMFMKMKAKEVPKLKNNKWICDLALLVNIATHMNEFNYQLQTLVSHYLAHMSFS